MIHRLEELDYHTSFKIILGNIPFFTIMSWCPDIKGDGFY